MIENKMDNSMELNEEQMETVAGGGRRRGSRIIPLWSGPCAHKFVKTGKHREVPILGGIFGWSNGEDEYECTICGTKVWSHNKP